MALESALQNQLFSHGSGRRGETGGEGVARCSAGEEYQKGRKGRLVSKTFRAAAAAQLKLDFRFARNWVIFLCGWKIRACWARRRSLARTGTEPRYLVRPGKAAYPIPPCL